MAHVTPSLLAKIADELRHNDECGPGPLSDDEYMDDARAILRIVDEHETVQRDRLRAENERLRAILDGCDDAAIERATLAIDDAAMGALDGIRNEDPDRLKQWALAALRAAGDRSVENDERQAQ